MKEKVMRFLPILFILGASAYADILPDIAEKFGQMVHTSSQCPKLGEGFYNADNTSAAFFIEVYDNKDTNLLELNFNGVEQVPINGKDTAQKNGFHLTGLCVDNSIRIVGKDASGGLLYMTIKQAADGGLQMESREPAHPAVHYTAAGGLKTPMDQRRKWFTPEASQKSGTGFPH